MSVDRSVKNESRLRRMFQKLNSDAGLLDIDFTDLGVTPTTLAGYGITDALKTTNNLSDVTSASTARTNLGLAAGTYTPTLTGVANVGASTAFQCQYLRIANVVSVSGRLDIDPTAAGATQLGISLPIASNFGATEDCGGVAFASGIAGQGAAIRADASNDRAELVYIAVDITNQPMYFQFQYEVI